MEDLEWAIHQTVHKRRGFSKQVADDLGMSQQVLLNKVNPEILSSHVQVAEAVKMMRFTRDLTILEVMAEMLNCKVIKSDKPHAVPVMTALLNVVKEHGDIGDAIMNATQDGVINEIEERHIIQQIKEEREALDKLEASIHKNAKQSRGEA